jgi:hypothetical protein
MSNPPATSQIITPHNVEGQALSSTDSVLFSWLGGDGAVDFHASLNGPAGFTRAMDWLKTPAWSLGSLPAGAYTLTVSGRNPAGETGSTINFNINSAAFPAATPRSLPIDERFESADSTWIATGLWDRDSRTLGGRSLTNLWGFNDGIDYSAGSTHGGSLTSPPIIIPAEGAKMLFEYYVVLGDSQPVWDERWLQISANGGEFVNFYQFQNDHMDSWLISPLFDLSAYAGQTIRLRWYFHVVDGMNNTSAGWFIDNLYVAANPPDTSCKDIPANDSPAQATAITAYGRSSKLYLCPSGDLDYYTFEAHTGDTLNIWVEARSLGASTDGVLYLLDSDGSSVLAWNDDPASGVYDPKLTFQFTHDGRYYLRFRDFRHPGYGGWAYYYYLNIYLSSAPPQVTITNPNSSWLPAQPVQLSAAVNNPGGSTSKVEFYRHSSNWTDPTWTLLGSDNNGSNGWTLNYTPSSPTDDGSTLYVRAIDRSGQIGGDVRWNLSVDSWLPTAAFQPLPTLTESTYIPLNWTSGDTGSGLASIELLTQLNGGAWQPWTPAVTLSAAQVRYLGQPGQVLGFRLNAQDMAGNLASPADQVLTTIEAACIPDAYEIPGDNQREAATTLTVSTFQEHNLCAAADEDWLTFTATETAGYLVLVQSLSGGAAASLEIYNSLGELVASASATDFGSNTALHLQITQAESYFLRIRGIDPNLTGSQVRYQVWAGPGFWIRLPLIQR